MTTILLADDSAAVRRVAELAFRETGWDVRLMDSGDHALEALPELRPAALVADVHMPGIDGYELCRQARAITPGLPVLLLVGSYEAFDDQAFDACGAQGVLEKPFKSAALVERVRDLIGAPEESARGAVAEEAAPSASFLGEVEAEGGGGSVAPLLTPLAVALEGADARRGLARAVEGVLSDADIDRIARRVVELMADRTVADVAWEVVPDVAEVLVRARLAELERFVEEEEAEIPQPVVREDSGEPAN